MSWQDITLGELARGAMTRIQQGWNWISEHLKLPAQISITINVGLAPAQSHLSLPGAEILESIALELEDRIQPLLPPAKRKPWQARTVLVESVLMEAWEQGIQTYPALIAEVRAATGRGCSRRAIARFIKSVKSQDFNGAQDFNGVVA